MNSRETAIAFVSQLPEEISLAEIAREVASIAGLPIAQEQAARGAGISPEAARFKVNALFSLET